MTDRPHPPIAHRRGRALRRLAACAAAGALLLGLQARSAGTELTFSNTATTVTYRLGYTGTPAQLQVFLDTDRTVGTGYPVYGIGANYLLENGILYRYSGSAGGWGWTVVKNSSYVRSATVAEMTVARADLGNPTGIDLVGVATGNAATAKLTQLLPAVDTSGNRGFESPAVATYLYNPVGAGWTFAGNSGVSANGSGFTAANPAAPEGRQVAFLQMTGSISQSLPFTAGATYVIRFAAAQRGNWQASSQDFRVSVAGKVVGTFRPAGTAYATLVTSAFTATSSTQLVTFAGLDSNGGDNTAFIDQVAIVPVTADTSAPSVPTGLGAVSVSSSQITLTWTAAVDNVGVTGYRIYRDGVQRGVVSGTTYADSGLAAATAYSYAVAAYDAAGNVSARSASAMATTNSAASPFTPPTLINPVSPVAYGARADDGIDDSAAFQAAINASDVKIPPGTFLINRTVSITMSNRHIEGSAGTVLRQTDGFAGRMFNILPPNGGRLTGDSIVNCYFLGANTVAPQYFDADNRHWNIPVQTQDRVDNFFLAGNTFDRFFGQSMFQTYGAVDGGSGDVIIYNTFKSSGYYGPVLCSHRNGYIAHNTIIDAAIGVENDNATQYTGGNIIEFNTVTAVHGYGAPDMGASAMLTGGAAGGADYSTNIVRNNTISGVTDALGAHGAGVPSMLIIGARWGVRAAQYSNNTIGAGCVIRP